MNLEIKRSVLSGCEAWSDLTQLLEACNATDGTRHPGRSELCAVLDSLDVAWAGFEHKPLGVKRLLQLYIHGFWPSTCVSRR